MEKGEGKVPLLGDVYAEEEEVGLVRRVSIESKKLWRIVGPAILSRIALYTMNVVTQAFAGHLGDLELASISIANTVVVGFSFGLLLGMASALETLCGQAFGAKKYHMLGIYMQRSWIVLFCVAVLLLPMYFFATPILKLIGQPDDIAEQAGQVSIWLLPLHFAFVFQFPLQRFLQCQLKNNIIAYASAASLVINIFLSWLFVQKFHMGLFAAALILNISWWIVVFIMFAYAIGGWCPLTWTGFSMEAFYGLWEFVKLSAAAGVMLCLENWYYRVLILLTGNLKNAKVAVDALSIWLAPAPSLVSFNSPNMKSFFFLSRKALIFVIFSMNINGWEIMIPLAFFAGTGVRVANELGAGNGKGAKFATIVSVSTSIVIGLFFWVLIVALHDKFALIFTTSPIIIDAVNKLAVLLAFTILLNSVQPILSGVAVGSGWQALVAYVNIGSYYLIGVPLGIFLGWIFKLGVLGIWAGMIGGTAVQTAILAYLTISCDWEKEAMKAQMRVGKDATVR
ncbi:protein DETOXIFICATION 27-like isoform X1 [Aristolochia californica]|uniref:protein DETOXIFICATION 27-like isoform X1 n=1 Tax=Aristolochia californica TaxID=171875 RepID=UPI0035D9A25D